MVLEALATGLSEDGLVVTQHGKTTTLKADRVVVAGGRRPNNDDLGLALAGVTPRASGHLLVDAARRTANPAVLALGDLTAGPALAHKAMAEADVAAATAAGKRAAFDPRAVPAVVFCELALAIEMGATAQGMALTMHPHPTLWRQSGKRPGLPCAGRFTPLLRRDAAGGGAKSLS